MQEIEYTINTTIPYDTDLEAAVIGSFLLDNDTVFEVFDFLKPEDFYFVEHKSLVKIIYDFILNKKTIDVLILSACLKEREELEKFGGKKYLAKLLEYSSLTNIWDYAKKVKELSQKRKLIEKVDNIFKNFLLSSYTDVVMELQEHLSKENNIEFVDWKTISEESYEKHIKKEDNIYIPTGFSTYDKKEKGLYKGDLVIIAGKTSSGKTTLAINLANKFLQDKRGIIVNLENKNENVWSKFISLVSGIPLKTIKMNSWDPTQFENFTNANEKIKKYNLIAVDSFIQKINNVIIQIKKFNFEEPLDFVIVDYLQLLSAPGAESRRLEVEKITREFKILAKELNCVVILISQLSREIEKREEKIPRLSDLRESGSIEQDADVVFLLYEESQETFLKVAKNRNGEIFEIKINFKKNIATFTEKNEK